MEDPTIAYDQPGGVSTYFEPLFVWDIVFPVHNLGRVSIELSRGESVKFRFFLNERINKRSCDSVVDTFCDTYQKNAPDPQWVRKAIQAVEDLFFDDARERFDPEDDEAEGKTVAKPF